MGKGFLEVVTTTAKDAIPVHGAKVTVLSEENVLYEMVTDKSGLAKRVSLEAPPLAHTVDQNYEGIPYSVCDVRVEAKNFVTVTIRDVEILDTENSILPVCLTPSLFHGESVELFIPPHNLIHKEQRKTDVPKGNQIRALSEVGIPDFITVHLGKPDSNAKNVCVPFNYYVKNCASHEIYSTWHDAAIEANIYCIISLALNRIFSKWYRGRGYNYDITNSTRHDQMFVEGGQIFQKIDCMVDMIFNRYLRKQGQVEPFFAEYCDGKTATCSGLWQWGTVSLANQGKNALQILHHFYPDDIQIVETDNIGGVSTPYPGFDLRPGMSGPGVRTMQTWLNKIKENFSAIPLISKVSGVYGPETEAAVKAFQNIRETGNTTGIVNRATWNKMSNLHTSVKKLDELAGEGIATGILRTSPTETISEGARGRSVQQAQYILNFISKFYPFVPPVLQDSKFGSNMTASVREFQRHFNLTPDGIIGKRTWHKLYEVYWNIRDNIKIPSINDGFMPPVPVPPYPGFLIGMGTRGDYVRQIQSCLNKTIGAGLNTDGIFGTLTQAAVKNYQRANGLSQDGIVGPVTWQHLMSRCTGATKEIMSAEKTEKTAETPTATYAPIESPTPPDYSVLKLENVPAFSLQTDTEKPTVVEVCDEVIKPEINVSNLLMYCLLREMKK